MKLIVLLLLLSSACSAQTITVKQAQKLSGEIVSCIKKNSIFSDSLNFETIQKDFEQQLDSFDTYNKVGSYYTQQLRKAGDRHSFHVMKNVLDNFSAKQKENLGFTYKLLDGDIGYLSIPGFYSTDNTVRNDFVNQVNAAIREMDSHSTIKGWIVDLRNDNGGDMWPMVSGLQPLIGNEVPGYFANANQKKPAEWKISSAFYGIKEPYHLKNANSKIAVLYSKQTGSSGEMTAICFVGKPNSRSFGNATAGLTSGNRVFSLSGDNIFVLSSSYAMDRNKKIYTGSIIPDVLIEKTDNDNVLQQAVNWVRE
jgi:C-terminal processing protease CtpA/Prc